jgi:hypothetical protein
MKRQFIKLVILCLATTAWTGRAETNQPSAAAALVAQLGGPDWEAREAAVAGLIVLGDEQLDNVLDTALEAYVLEADPEVRYRCKRVLWAVVSRHVFVEKRGFLGVSLRQGNIGSVTHEGETYDPIIIQNVLPNHAAQAFGVKQAEQILFIDNRRCNKENFTLRDLIEYIGGKRPGTEVRLLTWFGSTTIERMVKLGARPDMPNDPPVDVRREEFFKRWLDKHAPQVPKAKRPSGRNT